MLPSSHGGHNWHPQSYSRQTELVYISSLKGSEGYARSGGKGAYEKDAVGGILSTAAGLIFKEMPKVDCKRRFSRSSYLGFFVHFALGKEMNPKAYAESLAKMQYLADTKGLIRKDIQ